MSEDHWFGDFGKAKPEPNGVILSEGAEGVSLTGEEVNIMYEISKKRLEFDPSSDRIRTAYFLLFDKSTRGTIKQIKKQIKNNL